VRAGATSLFLINEYTFGGGGGGVNGGGGDDVGVSATSVFCRK
jgi:hypothetical protein